MVSKWKYWIWYDNGHVVEGHYYLYYGCMVGKVRLLLHWHKHIVISLKKFGFFLCWKKWIIIARECNYDQGRNPKRCRARRGLGRWPYQKRKQAQVARKPNKIWVKWAIKEGQPLILFYRSWKASTEGETPRKRLRVRSYECMQRHRSSCYRLCATSDILG